MGSGASPCRDAREARQESGAVSSEYAILASLIAVVIVGGVWLLGFEVSKLFDPLLGDWLKGG